MRNLVTVTVAAMLIAGVSACKKSEPAPAASEAAAPAATEAAATPAAAYTPAAGSYATSDKDGKAIDTTALNADGSYRAQPVKGLAEAGLWKMDGSKICFDPSGKKEATCYALSTPAADGSFTVTAPDGTVQNVKPVAK